MVGLNQSLFLGEISENIDLVVPFDGIDTQGLGKYLEGLNKDLLFH